MENRLLSASTKTWCNAIFKHLNGQLVINHTLHLLVGFELASATRDENLSLVNSG